MRRVATEREWVRGVAERWRRQYADNLTGWRKQVYDQLCALDDETATVADVAAIVRNDTWAQPATCKEPGCGHVGYDCVIVFKEHQVSDNVICAGCLRKALTLVDETAKHEADTRIARAVDFLENCDDTPASIVQAIHILNGKTP